MVFDAGYYIPKKAFIKPANGSGCKKIIPG